MPRPYRKVAESAELLRRAVGMLSHEHALYRTNPYRIIGSLDVLLNDALAILDPTGDTATTEAFLRGWEVVDALEQPELPFEA